MIPDQAFIDSQSTYVRLRIIIGEQAAHEEGAIYLSEIPDLFILTVNGHNNGIVFQKDPLKDSRKAQII